jgi:hypothetical protein
MTTRLMLLLGAAALAASAQDVPPPPGPPPEGPVTVFRTGGMMGGDVGFVSARMAGSPKLVKGAPYSAQTVSEHKETLADGNTIDRKESGAVYRDSEGRTRREQTLGPIGPLPAGATPLQLVFINDPVAGVNYVLHPDAKTADKLPARPEPPPGAPPEPPPAGFGAGTRTFIYRQGGQAPQGESLGTKTIEGVSAEGTRYTTTIPAGQIGNAKPIVTVSERWYSPQLQVTILSTTTDPRMGQTTYRLTNISLDEPAHSLFEVPADYQVNEAPQKGNAIYITKPTTR